MITHYDLFAGIGGFSIALEEVFGDEQIEHIFCEWEHFPTAVLKQHWPNSEYWGDIIDLVAYTKQQGLEGRSKGQRTGQHGQRSGKRGDQEQDWSIVTGGFPCQPFSHAGRRRGTADNRYQWPNMFEVIRNTKPRWVIAENVRGLTTWNDGLVLEQVCTDLEAEGYEVQPLIIPAVAKNAPHRRDRVWIIGNAKHYGQYGTKDGQSTIKGSNHIAAGQDELRQPTRPDSPRQGNARTYPNWERHWQEVAFATCNDTVDDGLSRLVDGVPYNRAKWRKESLKAYGNAIVPQVAMQVFKAIREAEETWQQK